MWDSSRASIFLCGGNKGRRTHFFFTCVRPFDFCKQPHAAVCEAEVLQAASLYLNILKRTENLHWFVSRFWNPVCLCSSAQVRKVKEHNRGVLVLFCWAAVGFRAFQVWFFWTELSEQVFSMQMVYFSGTCEPCLCKQGRRKLGVCHHSETSDKLLLCVPTTTCFGALSFFVYSVPLCFLLLESGQFKCPELKSGHLLHDLLLFTKAAEMYSLFGVGAGVTP